MLYLMEHSLSGKTIHYDYDSLNVPDESELEFRTQRVTDERGMEKTVLVSAFDKQGNRVTWPAQRSKV